MYNPVGGLEGQSLTYAVFLCEDGSKPRKVDIRVETILARGLRTACCVAAAFSLLAAPAARAANISYSFTTLDNQNDPTFNQLLGINDAGTIAGYFGAGTPGHPNQGYTIAPPYSQASYTNENFPGSSQTQVTGLNGLSTPTTVGFWADAAGDNFGFVDQSGTFTSITDPNTPVGTPFTQLLSVNNSNLAAGFYADSAGNGQGFTYNISTMQFTSIMYPGATSTTVTGVNNSDLIIGFYTDSTGTHGFLYNGTTFTSLNDPNGSNTMFFGLNNTGEAVGNFTDALGNSDGFVYNYMSNTWQTVNDPLASQTPAFMVAGTTINGLNDQGDLVGFYSDGTNVDGFLATPAVATPEPVSLFLASAGLLAFAFWKRRLSRA